MSSSTYRGQLDRKRAQRLDAEKKAGEYRIKESDMRTEAAKARHAADKATSASTQRSKLSEAQRKENEAASAGKEAGRWQTRAAGYAREETALQSRLLRAEQSEAQDAERRRVREKQVADRRVAANRRALENRVTRTEQGLTQTDHAVANVLRSIPAPKPEKLRILILGASSEGDLRVGREQKRIRAAVETALHRDLVELDVRPAATTADLLDGITRFRPHIVHFSGHSNEDLIVFEDENDAPHKGVIVTARAFARAVEATDTPPLLVLLNSCESAAQIDGLVAEVVPFAIGMSDSIDDSDAISYAAQFYAALANGQSIGSSHASGQAALELAGLESADLPTLACAADVSPDTVLVTPT